MGDILDLVTVGYNQLINRSYHSTYHADRWRDGVQRIFAEENIQYRIDREGRVHFQIDKEFTHATAAAISILLAGSALQIKPSIYFNPHLIYFLYDLRVILLLNVVDAPRHPGDTFGIKTGATAELGFGMIVH
jgi:hypothetical protein